MGEGTDLMDKLMAMQYVEQIRESRKTPRQRELEQMIQRISYEHQRQLRDAIQPLIDEIVAIEGCMPPLPVYHDGNLYTLGREAVLDELVADAQANDMGY